MRDLLQVTQEAEIPVSTQLEATACVCILLCVLWYSAIQSMAAKVDNILLSLA